VVQNPLPNGAAKVAVDKRPKPPKKRKSDEGDGIDRPKKAPRVENGVHRRATKIVTMRFRAWDRLPSRIRDKIRPGNATPAAASTIVATPAGAKRTALPGHPDSFAAARTGSPATDARASPAANGAQSANKKRKPLPSSAPQVHHSPPPLPPLPPQPSTPANGGEPAERPKKLIKLKLKSASQASPP
jgi:transcription initiation factor TFIID subunit 2